MPEIEPVSTLAKLWSFDGSNEQHWPTGPLGTAGFVLKIIRTRRTGAAATFCLPLRSTSGWLNTFGLPWHDFLFAASTFSGGHLRLGGFPQPAWLRRISFLHGHRRHIASIEAAFSEAYSKYSFSAKVVGHSCSLKSWWAFPGIGKLADRVISDGVTVLTPLRRIIAITRLPILTASRMPSLLRRSHPRGPSATPWDYRADSPMADRLQPALALRRRARA